MKVLTAALAAMLLLAGCVGGNVRPPAAVFDFGPAAGSPKVSAGVTAVEVAAPSWLAGSAIHYRLLYGDATRRESYADSRWAAPPAELLERSLGRRLAGEGRCRLKLELDELAQVFDDGRTSRLVLEGRAVLLAGREPLARHAFALARPAPTADARGGVAAASQAVAALGEELATWLAAQSERCRS